MIDFEGKSHKEYYDSIGISKQAFYRKLKGVTKWKQEEVKKLAKYLGLRVSVTRKRLKDAGCVIKPTKTTYEYKDGKFKKVEK